MSKLLLELSQELERQGLGSKGRELHPVQQREAGKITIRGRTLLDFANWDYLNLRQNPRLKRIAHEELEQNGLSTNSPRAIAGTREAHLIAEKALATFFGTQAALLFSSRNQAFLSLISSLCNERDVIFMDELVQGPVIDAAYLTHASVVPYRHCDVSALGQELERSKLARRKFIIVEAVSPVSGKLTDLSAVAIKAQQYGAELIVDESAATGAIGPRGAGGADLALPGAQAKILSIINDLTLSVSAHGTAIAGSSALIGYLVARSRTITFESSMSSHSVATIAESLSSIEQQLLQRTTLNATARQFRKQLAALIPQTVQDTDGPIVSVYFKKSTKAIELADALFSKGIFAEAVSSRTAFNEAGFMRFIINAAHGDKEVQQALQTINDLVNAKVFEN